MANFYLDNKDLKFHLSHPAMEKIIRLKERDFIDKQTYDYAPLDTEDAADSYDKVLEIVGDICGNIIEPNAESVDTQGPQLIDGHVKYAEGTRKNYEMLARAGMIGMSLPRKYSGLNFPVVPYVMAAEMVSRADGSFANIWGLQDCAETIHEYGNEKMKAEYLPRFANEAATAAMDLTEPDAGSDLQAVQLKATYDEKKGGWYLDGVKRFITNGDADIALVLARSEPGTTDGRGLSLFLYDKTDDAVKVRRIEHKLGIVGSPTCELVFDHAPVQLIGHRRMGLIKYVMSLMNSARLGIGAQSVGISEAAYREAKAFARERTQFGKPIIQFPAVYEMLTSMKVKLQAERSLLYETARFVDLYKAYNLVAEERPLDKQEKQEQKKYQRLAEIYTPLLKLISSEYCNQIAYDSLQIHGGSGFMKDYPIERIYRDARITSIYEGTSQLQVVAAIRGVTTTSFLKHIRVYEAQQIPADLEYLRRILIEMTNEYERTINFVQNINDRESDNEFLDFHARRLVEMVGNIIMGYLLISDSTRDAEYKYSAEIFIKKAYAENKEKANYIQNSTLRDLGIFKQ